MRVGLISDTHGLLRPEVFAAFEGVDLILHAGDVGSEDILIELRTIAPVHAVVGNTDGYPLAGILPVVETLHLEERAVVLTHGHLVGSPNAARLRAAHPLADVIVYGHTHKQRIERHQGALIINPGAAGPARFKLVPSVAILQLDQGETQATLIEL